MTRVIYWNNIPAPYMVDRFNAVARRANLDFEAWFSARTESDRSWAVDESGWQFPHAYLPAFDRGSYALALPTPLLTRRAPDVFVSLYAGGDFLLGSALARRRGARTAFWVEVTFDSWIERRRWKEALKSRVLPAADGILTAGRDGREFARRYGAHDERIHHVPHVIDYDHYASGSRLSSDERARLRSELGIKGTAFAYVGRLWEGKGLTYLFDAFAELQRRGVGDVTLVVVGDGPDEAALRARASDEGAGNVVFCGFRDDEVLPHLYAACDVFVFPTLGDPFGMVVLEAMACGLPVISTTAAGEICERVADGVNGFLVPPADSGALAERMTILARDGDLRSRMSAEAVANVAGHKPDHWAQAFEQAIDRILSMPRVRDVRSSRPDAIRGAVGDHKS
jgi:glycosyltransferase involved in cell wall biosynthesis